MATPTNIHATGIVLGSIGILLRGPSGAGKSLLALELLDDAQMRGLQAFLVADDRLDLSVVKDGLVMAAPPTIAGMIELRGRGIIERPYVASAPVHLIVDFVEDLIRLPEDGELVTQLQGVAIARCPLPNRATIDSAHQKLLVQAAIKAL